MLKLRRFNLVVGQRCASPSSVHQPGASEQKHGRKGVTGAGSSYAELLYAVSPSPMSPSFARWSDIGVPADSRTADDAGRN